MPSKFIYDNKRLVNNYSIKHDNTAAMEVIAKSSNTYGILNKMTFSVWLMHHRANILNTAIATHTTTTTSTLANGFGIFMNAANLLSFGVRAAALTTAQGSTAPVTNTWYHIIGTYDGSLTANQVNVYKNGVLGIPATSTGNITFGASTFRTGGFGSGSANGVHAYSYIDEVAIWNIGMTAQEAAAVYKLGKPGDLKRHSKAANLKLWWRMGDGDIYPNVKDWSVGGPVGGTMTNMSASNIAPVTIYRG